jgi:hypothetical protein
MDLVSCASDVKAGIRFVVIATIVIIILIVMTVAVNTAMTIKWQISPASSFTVLNIQIKSESCLIYWLKWGGIAVG